MFALQTLLGSLLSHRGLGVSVGSGVGVGGSVAVGCNVAVGGGDVAVGVAGCVACTCGTSTAGSVGCTPGTSTAGSVGCTSGTSVAVGSSSSGGGYGNGGFVGAGSTGIGSGVSGGLGGAGYAVNCCSIGCDWPAAPPLSAAMPDTLTSTTTHTLIVATKRRARGLEIMFASLSFCASPL